MTAWFGLNIVPATSAGRAYTITNDYTIGSTPVTIRVHLFGEGLVYFAPHYSEKTCVEAAKIVAAQYGGRIVQVVHSGQRNIMFTLDGKRYGFDPNRIFTPEGIVATLSNKQIVGNYSKEADQEVRNFAFACLVNMKGLESRVLVGLHNNTDGSYSVKSYLPGGPYARDAAEGGVHANKARDPDNFFFVTTRALYNRVVGKGYNAVLQDNRGVTNDGSLSVYCAWGGIPYVNVEAQQGRLREQIQMITVLQRGQ